jgi:ankyrin repeat protein
MSSEAVDAKNNDGDTALHLAVSKGHKEVCELLIPKMSLEAIDTADEDGCTALHKAIYRDHKEVCGLLISKMSPEAFDAKNNDDYTALHLAASKGHKEICKVLTKNMYTKKIMVLLNQSSNGLLIQKAVSEIVADFINDKFSSSEINPIDFSSYQIKLLKLYQVVDRDLLKSYLNEEKCINGANNYITKHYFTLIGVCKSVNEDSPISILVSSDDCMSCMTPYLAPHSLCPELFPAKLSGEDEVISSEN